MKPSIGDGEGTMLLDEVVEMVSNGRSLLRTHLWIDFSQILSAFSREISHEPTQATATSGSADSEQHFQPHLGGATLDSCFLMLILIPKPLSLPSATGSPTTQVLNPKTSTGPNYIFKAHFLFFRYVLKRV